jgi:hypothetical protein
MRKIILTVSLAAFSLLAFSQKVINDPNVEKRSATGFHAIEVSNGIDLYLSAGAETVAVSAANVKDRDRIRVEVKDGVLKIWYDYDSNFKMTWNNNWNKKLKAYVSYKSLDALYASGGSDVKTDGAIEANKFTLHLSGGSDFDGKISASDLAIEQSGGSDVSVSGKATNLRIHASGGSDLNGFEMVTETCVASASGGSDITITVNKELNASASGGSDVHYRGNATVKENKSGGSDIKKSGK